MRASLDSVRNFLARLPRLHGRPAQLVAGACVLVGCYLLALTLTPALPHMPLIPSTIALNTADDATDERDRIQIPKIDLEVPFFGGSSPAALDKGAWHRYPDRGNPVTGGNFILSAHRFNIGLTPAQTANSSPFYHIEKLAVGDKLRVYFDHKWYDYEVSRTYSVPPTAVEIEAPSKTAKLTLYSCTLKGSADGRLVIEALPVKG